jgi:hypothetical protein
MDFLSGHGATLTWGTHSLIVTSVSVSADAGSEIDMTSMSSEVVSDPYNSNRKLVVRDYDSCVSAKYGNELTVEFLCGTNMATASNLTMVGSKRLLTFAMKTGDGATGVATYINSQTALMTQLQLSGSVGELMRGSASFKISGR